MPDYVTNVEFDRFLSNHFKHLTDQVDGIEKKVDNLAWRLAFIIGGITLVLQVIPLVALFLMSK